MVLKTPMEISKIQVERFITTIGHTAGRFNHKGDRKFWKIDTGTRL